MRYSQLLSAWQADQLSPCHWKHSQHTLQHGTAIAMHHKSQAAQKLGAISSQSVASTSHSIPPRYLKRQPVKSLSCRQCLHEAGQKQFGLPVSSHEAYAWQTVRSLFRGHMLVEISVLGKRFAKADIWLPFDQTGQVKLNLVIQVDGEGHTCYPMQGRSVAEQQSRDASFNAECWKRDLKLLRLHHADKREWPACVCYAILRCLCKPDVTFRCWTSSYSQASIRSMSGMLHGN